jgi:hypothetical protein
MAAFSSGSAFVCVIPRLEQTAKRIVWNAPMNFLIVRGQYPLFAGRDRWAVPTGATAPKPKIEDNPKEFIGSRARNLWFKSNQRDPLSAVSFRPNQC